MYIKLYKKILYIIIIVISVVSLCSCSKKNIGKDLIVTNGIINLENWDFNNGTIRLDGKWEFYWNKLLSPKDLESGNYYPTGYYQVPMYWTKYDRLNLPSNGKATYRIRIKTNNKLQSLGLKTPEIYSEYKIWINGSLIDEHGSFTDKNVKYPNPKAYSFPSNNDTIDIVLQIQNYSHSNAGIGQSFILGTSDQIYKKRYLAMILEMTLIGICCFAGIYHIILFLFRNEEKKLLFLGLFSLAIALRTILTGEICINEFITNLSFDFPLRISTISVYLCITTFMCFTYYQFKNQMPLRQTKIMLLLNTLYLLIILFTPTYIFSYLFQYYLVIILISCLLIIYSALKCAVKGDKIAIVFSTGFVFLFSSAINDMLYYLQILETGYFLCVGFIIFILAQSILLAIDFANDYNTKKNLSRKLRVLDKLKGDFITNTSYELNTPLSEIIDISESLIDGVAGDLPNKALKNLEIIVSSSKRLSGLISDISDFSKLKGNDIILKNQKIDFKQLVSVVITIIQATKPNNKVLMLNEIPGDLPLIEGDESRLQQVMCNLISSSLKFIKEGCIKITAKENDKFIEICIEDTGTGLSQAKVNNIFNFFQQINKSIEKEYGEIDIGLSITKKIIELHGGKFWIKSETDKGTKLYFTLRKAMNDSIQFEFEKSTVLNVNNKPLIDVDEDINFSAEELENNNSFKILIVDDDMVNLQVICNTLMINNYNIDTATNGVHALELLEKKSYDLVLLDIILPKMSGYEVCKRIRITHTIYELPIIMLTTKNQTQDITTAFQLGANDYIVKPFDKNELLSRVNMQLVLKNAVKSAIDNIYFATIDALTNLNNRRYLFELGEKEFLISKAANSELSLIMTDIDFFKKFNDTYGHSAGDEVLKQVSLSIKKILRKNDIAGRYGGEEFVIILPDTNIQEAKTLAVNLRTIIENLKINIKRHRKINCTISVGVASRKPEMNNIEDLIEEADIALYKAKKNGRNRVEG